MLQTINISIDNAVAFRVEGKVTHADMLTTLHDIKAKIAEYGDIVIYEQIESISGVEVSAVLDELKYLFREGLTHIRKVAVVSDKKWIESVVNVENKIFRHTDIRYFDVTEKHDAIAFLSNSEYT